MKDMIMRNTQQQKHDYSTHVINMIERIDPRFFVTFVFNDEFSKNKATDKLAGFFAHINRKIAGSRWQKKPMENLLHGAIIFEHMNSNLHAHALLNAPIYVSLNDLQRNAEPIWKKMAIAGNVLVEDAGNARIRSWYCVEERFNSNFDQQVIWTNMLGEVSLQIN